MFENKAKIELLNFLKTVQLPITMEDLVNEFAETDYMKDQIDNNSKDKADIEWFMADLLTDGCFELRINYLEFINGRIGINNDQIEIVELESLSCKLAEEKYSERLFKNTNKVVKIA